MGIALHEKFGFERGNPPPLRLRRRWVRRCL